MGNEDMKVRVELWPVAADAAGLWLLSGIGGWVGRNVPADAEHLFDEACHILWKAGDDGLKRARRQRTRWGRGQAAHRVQGFHRLRGHADWLTSQDGEEQGFVHQTSARVEGPACLQTHAVIVPTDDYVKARWPDALPITRKLAGVVGKPFMHGPAEPPVLRRVDTLFHLIRHIAFLRDHDEATSRALGRHWLDALEPIEPWLAMMYRGASRATDRDGLAAFVLKSA